MTTTAKNIRKQLKTELGANARAISVRTDSYSMGSTVHVRIKSARYAIADVERIAKSHASVRYCEVTGETLNGGNTYVNVDYTADALDGLVAAIMPHLESYDLDPGTIETIFGVQFSRNTEGRGYVWGAAMSCWDNRAAARVIAETMLSGEHCNVGHALVELDRALEAGLDVGDAMARMMSLELASKAA